MEWMFGFSKFLCRDLIPHVMTFWGKPLGGFTHINKFSALLRRGQEARALFLRHVRISWEVSNPEEALSQNPAMLPRWPQAFSLQAVLNTCLLSHSVYGIVIAVQLTSRGRGRKDCSGTFLWSKFIKQ